MPIYEYECLPCGIHFEKLLPMNHRNLPTCPFCGNKASLKISRSNWFAGWKFLKDKSEKSPEAPSGSQYESAWDEEYQGQQAKPKASPL